MKKIILLSLVAILVGCQKSDEPKQNLSNSSEPTIELSEDTWQVYTDKDEMRESEAKWLALRSENSANLDFPYDGENHLTLHIYDSKTKEPSVFLIIDKGQYDCGQYGCYGAIKFGKTTVQEISFREHDVSGSNGTILRFDGNVDAFLSNVKRFKEITVELPFYRSGVRQFKFNTSGFTEAEKNI